MPSLFLPRSRPWLWATAAEGGLEPAPASRFRGALPHRLNSYALLGLSAFRAHGALSPAIRKFRGEPGRNVRIADNSPGTPPIKYFATFSAVMLDMSA